MPEYLREKDAQEWFDNPDRLVITEPKQISDPVLELFNWVEGSVPRITMRCLDAEIAKLAHNAYIATKVTFTCEVERLCILHDANAHNVMFGTNISQIVILMVDRDLVFQAFTVKTAEFNVLTRKWKNKLIQFDTQKTKEKS